MNPLSTAKNPYYDNRKDATVFTPHRVAEFLFYIIYEEYANPMDISTVVDPCVGKGSLLKPWAPFFKTIGYDVEDFGVPFIDRFERGDFFEATPDHPADLVVCNPPFNKDLKNTSAGNRLIPEMFLDRIFEVWGEATKAVLFAPMGMRLNQRIRSKRWRAMRDRLARITSIVSMPLDIFPGVEFHNEILLFNMPELEPHYFLPEEVVSG